jgi:hypothetical protein
MPAIQRQRCGGRKLEVEQFATADTNTRMCHKSFDREGVSAIWESNFRRRSRFAFRLETARLLGPGGRQSGHICETFSYSAGAYSEG